MKPTDFKMYKLTEPLPDQYIWTVSDSGRVVGVKYDAYGIETRSPRIYPDIPKMNDKIDGQRIKELHVRSDSDDWFVYYELE